MNTSLRAAKALPPRSATSRITKIYDVVLGRSEVSLESYFRMGKSSESSLHGSSHALPLASKKTLPQGQNRCRPLDVIRLVNQHYLHCWRELDPVASKSRGLLSLMRRHRHNLKPEKRCKLQAYLNGYPALDPIYRFKQRLVTYC